MQHTTIHTVGFSTDGMIPVKPDQTLLSASLEAGIPHFHVCGGNAKCSTCRVLVLEGADQLTDPNEKEQSLKNRMRFPPNVRLACQTFVTGPQVKLVRVIRDENDIDLYVGAEAGNATQQIGEEKELTLFFLDIRNFTVFVETNPPFDVIHIIRKLFLMFRHQIEQYNGRMIETAGDSIYAVFGFGEAQKAPADAVQAGFSMLQNLEEMNRTYFGKFFGQSMDIGIGIHRGKVISGNIQMGVEKKTTVMGFPVNIAARLQNATKELNNNFIISDTVYKQLPEPPAGTHRQVKLKGVSGDFPVWLIGKPYGRKFDS